MLPFMVVVTYMQNTYSLFSLNNIDQHLLSTDMAYHRIVPYCRQSGCLGFLMLENQLLTYGVHATSYLLGMDGV